MLHKCKKNYLQQYGGITLGPTCFAFQNIESLTIKFRDPLKINLRVPDSHPPFPGINEFYDADDRVIIAGHDGEGGISDEESGGDPVSVLQQPESAAEVFFLLIGQVHEGFVDDFFPAAADGRPLGTVMLHPQAGRTAECAEIILWLLSNI